MDEDESGTIEFDEMVTYFDQAAYAHPVFYTTLLRCMKQVHCPFIKRRTRVLNGAGLLVLSDSFYTIASEASGADC